MRRAGATVLILLGLCGAAPIERIESGGVRIGYRAGAGFTFELNGVPLVRASSIQLHDPGWKQGFYSSNNAASAPQFDPRARRITVRHATDKSIKFDAIETLEFISDNEVQITLAGRIDAPDTTPVALEWAIGYVNASALYDGSVLDVLGSAKPLEIRRETLAADDKPELISGAKAIEIRTRVGRMLIKVIEGDASLTVLDGRRAPSRWWAQESPTFWVGALNVKPTPGQDFVYRIGIEFDPAAPTVAPPASTIETKASEIDLAFEPPKHSLLVIPKPRRMQPTQRAFVLRKDERVFGNEVSAAAAGEFARFFSQRFDIDAKQHDPKAALDGDDAPRVDVLVDPEIKPQGYSIRASENALTIFARDDDGFRFARQTLLQLARRDAQGNWTIPGVEIDDEPSLAFRGVHIFPGRDAMDLHRRLVENVFARFKVTHVLLECEYTQWDSARGVWVDISVPKQQIAEYVALLREHGIEPIPLVSSMGHAAWMFKNDQNLDLAEDPEKPVAYDATNPQSQAWMQRIYDEAISLFSPVKYFHIGHDEVALFGRYPHREESKKWGITKLFLHDIAHWDRYLRQRNIRMMLWGDMLLARDEINDGAAMAESVEAARQRRETLPKDAIICDWHYDALPPEKYASLKIFKDAGFTTIAASWFNPQNIFALAQAARDHGAWGLLQTTWAGYNIDDDAIDRELKQFAAYILAAEYAWSADSPAPKDLPYNPADVIARALNPVELPTTPRRGVTLDLTSAGDAKLPLLIDFSARLHGLRFAQTDRAVVLGGALLSQPLPRSVAINADFAAGQIAFLHATSFSAPLGQVVGRYEIVYLDGTVEPIELKYGRNIRAWDDPGAARQGLLVAPGAKGAGAYCMLWTNPHPHKAIKSIRFTTDHPYAAPMLIAATGLAP